MDIISEILETDRLADEKLEEAGVRKLKIGEDTQKEISDVMQNADKQVAAYRIGKENSTQSEISKAVEEISADEKTQKDNIDTLYENNHSQWEKSILDRILSI